MLDFLLLRCAWQAARRSPEHGDFWRWLWNYRKRSRPVVLEAISRNAGIADVYVLRNRREVERFVSAFVAQGKWRCTGCGS